ncbi:glycosyltransferase [Megalodesulfovibrio gigas]|uniref:Putative glycosyltransferase n=1 Tax=Megalodesulfovibrio gigas (strain ATCC 19364 / DSM 1382 / NCIMB 9332 / VKM B-1759) TaxID=1121448 RepID=T2GCH4_MEGG1|nr:glycosyltransferase [Megalodesulfovibrio gigas]AGW14280.1 putative glycosyltransferase [Megalodesulfovibrio gigas DSM 1382 = ATCC 19364]
MHPRVAYISLWLPKPSETFIMREILCLREQGVDILPTALYGPLRKHFSREMQAFASTVTRLGLRHLSRGVADERFWWKRDPAAVRECLGYARLGFRTLERTGENLWALHAGFRLARMFEEHAITHMHAPWATGPAMAAMVASRLTGIPFSFAARAGDIYPPEQALQAKIARAAFVRVNTQSNVTYLRSLVPVEHQAKILNVYNAVTLIPAEEAPVFMTPPVRILAIGRFVKTKGFDDLLRACAILKEQEVDFLLTLAGSGGEEAALKQLARELNITDRLHFPGFVTHEEVSRLLDQTDCFVMPSVVGRNGDRDGIPNVIMEACTHRVPVVATDCSGIGEVIRNGETGRLVPQRNPEALAAALRQTLADRAEALRLAAAAKTLVLSLFDQQTNCATLRALFTEKGRKG